MRYVGGKVRQAAQIRDIIQAHRGDRSIYLEPFVGGASVLALTAPLFGKAYAGDTVPDLIKFWRRVQRGWRPPAKLTRARYEALLAAKPSALRAWAGFAASYNGKWWGGYGPCAAGRDYLAESARSTEKKAKTIDHVVFRCRSFDRWTVDDRYVVYCDPPYAHDTRNHHHGRRTSEGATDARYGSDAFDHTAFWRVMHRWHRRGALVLVSEYTAPDGWSAVVSVKRTETMNHRKASSGVRHEHLWMRED